jgi:tRNA A-37 threonylcarbamoyl transferase component Bud32
VREAGRPVAALALRFRPEDQFTHILRVARSGRTGETYAFDRQGLLLSQSRFDEDLKQIGLLADQPDSRSILTLEVRDPQVNMAAGERPRIRRPDQPLTRMAGDAVRGRDGHDADGYRDYRGVPVVGAWRWLGDLDFGVATEMDVAEAFRPVSLLRGAFAVLMALLILSAAGTFLATLFIARQQRALRKASTAARKLGQYTLLEKLGGGGMGSVYKARHALLRRPTAVKLLNVDRMSDTAVARFEREVQLTAGLTHPNTVAVYDYGRTPDGTFYYAMEYLDGVNLDDLVTRCGPLPEARLLYILRQVCGSLAEAHAQGLVHRDIKPANIALTCRGGLHDFVKVLDFGLVKALAGPATANLTSPNTVTGTPLYMSPEAASHPEQIDARADVYAIGAVGYFLLTGSPVFSGDSVMEICMQHVNAVPESPSARCGRPVGPDLEALLLHCLAKSRSDRPADAADLLHRLERCAAVPGRWTAADASSWWAAHGETARAIKTATSTADSGADRPTVPAGVPVIAGHRQAPGRGR